MVKVNAGKNTILHCKKDTHAKFFIKSGLYESFANIGEQRLLHEDIYEENNILSDCSTC